jgi:hypothetical protein
MDSRSVARGNEFLRAGAGLPECPSKRSDGPFLVKWDHTASIGSPHYDMATALAYLTESHAFQDSNGILPGKCKVA